MAVWNPRANKILASVLEVPAPQRQAYLEQACAGDSELKGQVEALLAAHGQAGSFLDRPVNPAETATLPPGPDCVDPLLGIVRYIGDYELLAELGRGGMGVVYKARQASLKRLVALKMILAGGHAGAADLARFRTECEAIARLQHPNIVQVYEVGEHEGKPFFSLEFCPGGSLDKKLDGTPWQPGDAARLLETLARAMHAAYEKKVIHRDLKPANILLSEKGLAKITDFGLARKIDEAGQTASAAVMGTPSYMAPEQAEGKKDVGPAADVYALGAILYECLTGRPPFKAATPLDTAMQVVSDEPVPLRRLQSKTPVDLETICLKCLQKEPMKRYTTALELAEDLQRFQAGRPVLARPVGQVERGWRWCRRNPAVAGLVATVALTLLLGAGVATVLAVRADREANQARIERDRADEEARKAQSNAERAEAEKAKKEEQLKRAEMSAYVNRITLAQVEWDHGSAALAWDHLEACQWDLRGWEHRYLVTLFNKNALKGRTAEVSSVAFSPDGKHIVSASFDNSVKVWDADKGQ